MLDCSGWAHRQEEGTTRRERWYACGNRGKGDRLGEVMMSSHNINTGLEENNSEPKNALLAKSPYDTNITKRFVCVPQIEMLIGLNAMYVRGHRLESSSMG